MTTEKLASLEKVIDKWIEANCDDMGMYWPNDAAARLAKACEIIIDACGAAGDAAVRE